MRSSTYKNDDFNNRLTSAANAKNALLERFRARPGPDDPAVIARRAAQAEIEAAREVRMAERKAAREAADAARAAERAAEAKAARDARYAARRARKR